ncbi:glycosyltransferase family 2 protein [Helicobacter trogontum]|uniref:Glycosyltransferase family 2 protein n=1 Tax=Helicobacter trogontum TaxID=50960 RepID=A0A4U8T9Z4_9HELI|nr:glycosyltransferase family 2 protein [Helicobacter trogontum]MDY5184825.1 glycosyltransferase family 2 protein [Helicobacter trogontum]TLD96666.1 glycosyltransferase family 2 protein [Helicobacter trogontum]
MQEHTMLTIILPTFNKKDYIAQTLDSIFMQKTTYSYQIIIADDASNDGTLDIVRQYSLKYPKAIKILESNCNQKLFKNIVRAYEITKTEYFCVLDPDDYWIDEEKIQKALDFLEQNKEFTIYFQNTHMLYDNGETKEYIGCKEEKISTFDDYLNERAILGHTSSCIFRNVVFKEGLPTHLQTLQYESNEVSYRGDSFRNLIHMYKGKAMYKPQVDSIYRIHKEGIWQSLNTSKQMLIGCIFHKDMYFYFDKQHMELLFFSYRLYERFLQRGNLEMLFTIKHADFISLMNELYGLHEIYKPSLNQLKAGKKPKTLKYKLFLSLHKFLHKKLTTKGFL